MRYGAFVCLPATLSLDSVQTGTTALYVASQEGHCEVVRILLEAKADVNIKDNVSESRSSDGVCAFAKSRAIGRYFVVSKLKLWVKGNTHHLSLILKHFGTYFRHCYSSFMPMI